MPRAHTYYGSLDADALASLGSMEGLDVPIVVTRAVPGKSKPARPSIWPGYAAALLIATAAYLVHYLPFAPFRVAGEFGVRRPVSPAIIAILLGAVARNVLRLPHVILEGCKGIVRKIIPVTIVLTGFSLNLTSIEKVGARALVIILACIGVATGSAYVFGRMLKLWKRTALLIGAGTAICGNSAIVAVAPLIDATDEDLMLSMSTINLLGLPLMFLFPLAGAMMGLGDQAYGVWAGTSIHAVPQVVAAAFAFSPGAGSIATLVKLVRVALLCSVHLRCGYRLRAPQAEGRRPGALLTACPAILLGFRSRGPDQYAGADSGTRVSSSLASLAQLQRFDRRRAGRSGQSSTDSGHGRDGIGGGRSFPGASGRPRIAYRHRLLPRAMRRQPRSHSPLAVVVIRKNENRRSTRSLPLMFPPHRGEVPMATNIAVQQSGSIPRNAGHIRTLDWARDRVPECTATYQE